MRNGHEIDPRAMHLGFKVDSERNGANGQTDSHSSAFVTLSRQNMRGIDRVLISEIGFIWEAFQFPSLLQIFIFIQDMLENSRSENLTRIMPIPNCQQQVGYLYIFIYLLLVHEV